MRGSPRAPGLRSRSVLAGRRLATRRSAMAAASPAGRKAAAGVRARRGSVWRVSRRCASRGNRIADSRSGAVPAPRPGQIPGWHPPRMSVRYADPSLGGHPILAGTHGVIRIPGGCAGPTSGRPPGTMALMPLDPLIPQRPGCGPENPECLRCTRLRRPRGRLRWMSSAGLNGTSRTRRVARLSHQQPVQTMRRSLCRSFWATDLLPTPQAVTGMR